MDPKKGKKGTRTPKPLKGFTVGIQTPVRIVVESPQASSKETCRSVVFDRGAAEPLGTGTH